MHPSPTPVHPSPVVLGVLYAAAAKHGVRRAMVDLAPAYGASEIREIEDARAILGQYALVDLAEDLAAEVAVRALLARGAL